MKKVFLKYLAEKIDELLTKADEQMATKTDLAEKVDKVDGKGLSTNDYTTAEKNKLAGIQEGAQKNKVTSVRGALELYPQVGDVVISAGSIGLGDANQRLNSLENDKLDKSEKGATNGVASLDENGRVPSSQLPSYVDDVIEVANYESLPTSGESGKIYITQSDNKTYRWSGNGYAEISASLALGETEQTAYSGAKGKKNAEDIATLQSTKASKAEAQGYATTAENNANDYTDGAVDDLAKGQVATNKTNIATHTQQIANLDSNKLGKNEKAADSAKLGGVGADGYTRVLKGFTTTANNHLYIGTLPASSNVARDSISIRGTIGGFGGDRDFVDIAIGWRNGLWFKGLATFRYTGTSSYWDIAVNDAGEVYVLLYALYCAYHIEVSSQQVTIEGTHGKTPTDTNWRYLREELIPFDRFKAGLFQTSPMSTSQPTRFSQLTASGLFIFGSTTSGWASGMTCFDADSNSLGTIAGAYGSMSYTPSYFFYGGAYNDPIIKARINGAVEMKSTLTTKDNITAPNFTGGIRDTLPSSANNRALVYTAGTKIATAEPTADSAYVGSSPDRTVLSVPLKDGLDTALNVTNLRLPYNAAFFSDIATCPNSNQNIWYRNVKNGVAGAWKRFVLEGHNAETWNIGVTSATKLATPRTIWGQSFNGTQDITGPLISDIWRIVKDITYDGIFIQSKNYAGTIDLGNIYISAWGGSRLSSFNVWANKSIFIGNVGIGTTTPSEKLDVAGNIKASGMLTTGSDAEVGGAIDVEGGITSRGDIDASGNNILGNLSGTIDRVANSGDNATPIHLLGLPTEDNNTPLIDAGVIVEGGVISAAGFETSGTVEAETVDADTLKGSLDGTIKKTTRDTNLFLLGFAQEAGAAAKPYVTTQVSLNNGVLTIKGLRVEGDVEITGNTVIGGRLTSAASYQSSPISTTSEEDVPTTEEQLRAQISTLEERIEALERLIAQNNG